MRVDYFIFGYVEFSIETEDIHKVVTALLRANLGASISQDGKFCVSVFRREKYIKALGAIIYKVSEVRGLSGWLLKNKKRYGLFSGLIIVLLFFLFVSNFIWDIRIEGNENISSALIETQLYDAGVRVGTSWKALSLSEAERRVLELSEDIGWVNINRRGNVAYVTVKEKSVAEESEKIYGFSNIVAASDCVIEEITVRSGIAMVKPGDTVKAGDLLISGMIPSEFGGGFTRADGDVFGRLNDEISIEVYREEKVVSYGDEFLDEAYIKIFNFSAKFFKNYRKMHGNYVIIEDVKECVILGKRIPVSIIRIFKQQVLQNEVSRTDKELTDAARAGLAKLRIINLSDSELLKMKTYGEFTEQGYKMTSSVIALRDVGEEKFFYKEN